jgi:acyl carrier protein
MAMKERQEISSFVLTRAEIRRFILAHFLPGDDEKDLQDDDLLFESGIIDSAGAMTFVSFLEEYFGIEVLDEELFPENFATVTDIVKFVQFKTEKPPHSQMGK